jgi:hypothetical protein
MEVGAVGTVIDVQVGALEETRKVLHEELSVIVGAAAKLTQVVRIERIVAAADFASVVATAVAETGRGGRRPAGEPHILSVPGRTGWVMVLHPRLFGPGFDAHIRHALYWHELTRLVHKMTFPALLRGKVDRERVLMGELYRAFGEYDAARKAWAWRDALVRDALHEELSGRAVDDFVRSLAGQAAVALGHGREDMARRLNDTLRKDGDVAGFLSVMRGMVVQRTVALALAWAGMDHAPDKALEVAGALRDGLPVAAQPLLSFFRNRHVSGVTDLREGVALLDALWQAWGLHLADGPDGLTALPVEPF